MNNKEYGNNFTIVLHGVQWLVFICASESPRGCHTDGDFLLWTALHDKTIFAMKGNS